MPLKVVKGTVSLMVAQAVFLLSAYVMNILLARFLGPERYGVLGIIFSILALFQIMLITGTPRAASQVIAAGKASARQAERLSNWLLVGGGIAVGGLFALAAPLVAGLLGDPSLVPYLRLSALFIPAYGLYCSLLGVVQGFRKFTSDAAAKVVYALAKAFFVVALALTPLGISGAVLGFAVAPILAWVALRVSFRAPQGGPDGGVTLRSLFILALPFMGVSILINLASSLDLFFLKALTSDDALTGQYAAALNLAKAPALLFQSLGTVLFPTVVALHAKQDMAEIRRIARQSTRYFLLFSLPFAALVIPAAPAIMALFFGEPYRAGGPALALLVLGSLGLALASILSSVVMGISGLRISLAVMAGMVAVSGGDHPLRGRRRPRPYPVPVEARRRRLSVVRVRKVRSRRARRRERPLGSLPRWVRPRPRRGGPWRPLYHYPRCA